MIQKELKIELNGKLIFSQEFQINNKLISVREKIKEKVKCSFIFLDKDNNPLNYKDENYFIIEEILVGQIIKLKSLEDINSNKSKLNIFLNNKKMCSMSLDKGIQLNQTRILINNEIKENFIFLDIEGKDIEEIEEKDFIIDDILNNGDIKLKIVIDFSKYEVLEKTNNLTN